MPDLLERYLDDDISRTLKLETSVTPSQKAAAWERLQARAKEQSMLPPLEAETASKEVRDSERVRWLEMVYALRDGSMKLLNTLVLDSTAFERANAPKRRYPYPYFDIQGRSTHPILAISA